jgi:hypothetical protein
MRAALPLLLACAALPRHQLASAFEVLLASPEKAKSRLQCKILSEN